jgi:hypothetical protein
MAHSIPNFVRMEEAHDNIVPFGPPLMKFSLTQKKRRTILLFLNNRV